MELYLTRHGQTLLNRANRAQGWSDALLTEKGRTDAIALGRGLSQEKLQFDAAFSSDLSRAVTTAKIVLHELNQDNLALEQLTNFREECFGYYEGEVADTMSQELFNISSWHDAVVKEHKTVHDLADAIAAKFQATQPEDGESYAVLQARLMAGLNQVVAEAKKNNWQQVLIVAHGNAITTILETLGVKSTEPLHNASVSILIPENDQFTIKSVDDTSYIEKGRV